MAGKLGLAMCPSRSSYITSLQMSVSFDTTVDRERLKSQNLNHFYSFTNHPQRSCLAERD